jgi:AcrR family transcriptional regulator
MPVAARVANKRGSTRSLMVATAAEVLREKGTSGVTIDEVLARSGAPRGSVYHHFPDGRAQLLAEALRSAGDAITAIIDDDAGRGCVALMRRFVAFWERTLIDGDFTAGCPVLAAAISSADDDSALITLAGDIFSRWRDALARALVADGFDDAVACSLAVTCIASLEGAVVLCRSTRSVDPLREVSQQIEFLIESREFVRRFGLPSAGH